MSDVIERVSLRLGKFNCDDIYTNDLNLKYVSEDGVTLKNRDFIDTCLWKSFEENGREYVELNGVKYFGVQI